MIKLDRTRSFAGAKRIAANAAKVALIASPVVFAASPSQAFQSTFTDFVDPFKGPAPGSQWTNVSASGGTRTFANSGVNANKLLTLTASANTSASAGSTGGVSYATSTSVFDDVKPVGAGAFTTGTLSFDWRWRFTAGSGTPTTNTSFIFQTIIGGTPSGPLNLAPLSASTNASPIWSSLSSYSAPVSAGQAFSFNLGQAFAVGNGVATVEISNYKFIANFAAVPGPLPIAGAAVAFGWSRKLRRRLKVAGTQAC